MMHGSTGWKRSTAIERFNLNIMNIHWKLFLGCENMDCRIIICICVWANMCMSVCKHPWVATNVTWFLHPQSDHYMAGRGALKLEERQDEALCHFQDRGCLNKHKVNINKIIQKYKWASVSLIKN